MYCGHSVCIIYCSPGVGAGGIVVISFGGVVGSEVVGRAIGMMLSGGHVEGLE